MSHRNSDRTSRQKAIKELGSLDELELESEPDNKYDKNAIRVLNREDRQIGFLDAQTAHDTTREMKDGANFMCFVTEVTGWEHPRLGVNIAIVRWWPYRLVAPKEQPEDLEAWLNEWSSLVKGEWFYTRVVGTRSHLHQHFIKDLEIKQQLRVMPESGSEKLIVTTIEYGVIGYLDARVTKKLKEGIAAGFTFMCFVCETDRGDPGTTLEVRVAILRGKSEEFEKLKASETEPHQGSETGADDRSDP